MPKESQQVADPQPTDAAPPPASETAPQQASHATLLALIEKWFVDHLHNSPASRDTLIFNHVRQAVEELKRRIEQEI
jgi:hypothetical protein